MAQGRQDLNLHMQGFEGSIVFGKFHEELMLIVQRRLLKEGGWLVVQSDRPVRKLIQWFNSEKRKVATNGPGGHISGL